MANRLKGELSLTVEGKEWRLVLDMNAIAEFEDAAGVASGLQWFAALSPTNQPSSKHMICLIWAALQRRHPDATKQDAGDLLSEDTEILAKLISTAMPQAEAGNVESPPKKRAK